jgi:SOS-response transcriptional repressor LexA
MKHSPTILVKIYTVQAWFPTFGRDQNKFVRLDLNSIMIPNPMTTILCEVVWESMIWAWIYPWDTLLVDRNRPAKDWNIIVAEIDGGKTVKYLRVDNNGVKCLQWAAMQDQAFVYPQESMSIFGVVVSSFRTYL